MPRNIEIKARIPDADFEDVRARTAAIATARPEVLHQTDTFFKIPEGRLKLREFSDGTAELIFYNRPDQVGPKASSYVRSTSASAQPLREVLVRALGIRGVVEKRREVFMVGQTRIHLDDVRDLGPFLELEVVLREGQSDSEGEAIVQQLLEELGVRAECLVSMAYIDLLERGK